jgi:uncharacterized repeat protein (TIGR01451 family)
MNKNIRYFVILIIFVCSHVTIIFAQSDVALTAISFTPVVTANDSVSLIITLINEGKTSIRNIKVVNILPQGISYLNHFTEIGYYDTKTQIWEINNILSNQTKIAMILTLKVDEKLEGPVSIFSEITQMSEIDIDSTPGNGIEDFALLEDDFKFTCISVPVLFDNGSKISVTINANNGYNSYQWYRNGNKIEGATESSYLATDFGDYTFKIVGTKYSPDCELFVDCPFVIAPKK